MGVDPKTCTNKTVNFRITGLRLPVQKQLIAKISSTDRTFTFVTPPTVYLSGTTLLKQIITSETGPSLQSEDLNPTAATSLLCHEPRPFTGGGERSGQGACNNNLNMIKHIL